MRTFVIAVLVFVASFGVPHFASAQSCTVANAPCSCGANTGICIEVTSGTDTVLSCNASCNQNQNQDHGSNPSGGGVTLINPLKSGTTVESFLNSILDFVIKIGSIIVILMIVFVGFKFVVAQGKPDKIEEAKKMLLWTIIGALVLIGAKVISSGIVETVKKLG